MQKFFFQYSLFFLLFFFFLSPVFAQGGGISIPFGHNTVSNLSNVGLKDGAGQGIQGAEDILATVGNFLKKVLGPVAMLLLFIAGYQLITAQAAASEEMTKQKMNVVYILLGLVGFAFSSELVYNYLFADEGKYLLEAEAAKKMAQSAVSRFKEVISIFLSFAGAATILMLVLAGLSLVVDPGNEENIEKKKKTVGYTIAGIIVIGFAETLIDKIIFPNPLAAEMSEQQFLAQLTGLQGYILGFLGVGIFVTLVICGVLMVANFGNDEMMGKIKTTIKNVFIGSFLVFSSYTIVAEILKILLSAK